MKYPAGISGAEYAAMEEGYEQGRASVATEIEAAVAAARKAVADYCRYSEALAREGGTMEGMGLARAYQDVADRLDERLSRG